MTDIRFQQDEKLSPPQKWPTVPRVGEHVAVMVEGFRASGMVKWVAWKPDGSVVVSLTPPFALTTEDA